MQFLHSLLYNNFTAMMSRRLAMPLLGVLLWVLSIHAGTFAEAILLPAPETGLGGSHIFKVWNKNNQNPAYPLSVDDDERIPGRDLNKSVNFGSSVVDRMSRLETNLGWSDIHVRKGTPSHGQFIVSSPENEALQQGKNALIVSKATVQLMNNYCNKYKLNNAECSRYIQSYKLTSTPLKDTCTKLLRVCSAEESLSSYRSIDGGCNHKTDASLGQSFTSYKRLLHSNYLDGVQELRRSVNKKDSLPSPRFISTTMIKDNDNIDKKLTLAVLQWSQFVEHDLSHTATSKMIHTKKSIECCSSDGSNLSPRYVHPFCSPISIPFDDQYYSDLSLDCMSYVRSVTALRPDCSFGPNEQLNQATHFLDASQIYGSTLTKNQKLRRYDEDGKLDFSSTGNNVYLLKSTQPMEDCQVKSDKHACFVSGDSRVNVNPSLTVMHTLFLREHNRIAAELSYYNPHWDGEVIFEEARKIVIAEIQHITYHEWIPEVFGKKYLTKILRHTKYDENTDPSVSNSFATAAIRAIYSQADEKLKLYTEDRNQSVSLNLRDYYNKPEIIEKSGYFDGLIRGLSIQSSQKVDLGYVKDLTNHLFSNGNYGFDILSLDIQRGRDHGLPSYVVYRELCGLAPVTKFEDFLDVMSPKTVSSLKEVYVSPLDVDLIVGGISERSDGDSLFGPTLSCILTDQFLRTYRGDRYFYTNNEQPAPFSESQLREIKKVTLARIFCDNSDNIKQMQRNVFHKLNKRNTLVSCETDAIPKVDLRLWTENRNLYF